MTPPPADLAATIARVRAANAWRRGDESQPQPNPRQLGEDIDTLCDVAERVAAGMDTSRG